MEENEILKKIAAYCAYQDRSEKQVLDKLRALDVEGDQAWKILEFLKSANYLDNQRFAISFVRGKFFQKKWGRFRIKMELQKHSIGEEETKTALGEISEGEYRAQVLKLIRDKKKSLRIDDKHAVRDKIYRFLYSKGYESELVLEILNREI